EGPDAIEHLSANQGGGEETRRQRLVSGMAEPRGAIELVAHELLHQSEDAVALGVRPEHRELTRLLPGRPEVIGITEADDVARRLRDPSVQRRGLPARLLTHASHGR